MGIISDLWSAIPKQIKIIFGVALFLNIGVTLLNVLVFVWNLLVVNAVNALNGCLTDPKLCMPASDGIFIFGINFADYWIVNALIFFPVLALFAIKWYSMTLKG